MNLGWLERNILLFIERYVEREYSGSVAARATVVAGTIEVQVRTDAPGFSTRYLTPHQALVLYIEHGGAR